MMANIVSGLFGLTPEQVAQQQRAQMVNASNQYASADPMQRAQAGLFQLGAGLGNVGAEMSGGVNREVQSAQQEQALSQGIDFTNVDSIIKGSQRAEQAGNPQFAQKLADYARTIQEKEVDNQFKINQYAPKPEKPADTDIVTKQLGNGWRQDFVVDKQNNIIRPWSERYRDAEKTSGGSSGGGKPDGKGAEGATYINDQMEQIEYAIADQLGLGEKPELLRAYIKANPKNASSTLEGATGFMQAHPLNPFGVMSQKTSNIRKHIERLKDLSQTIGVTELRKAGIAPGSITQLEWPKFQAAMGNIDPQLDGEALMIQYNRILEKFDKVRELTAQGRVAPPTTPVGVGKGYDAAKEARYQAWKAQQGK